MAAAAAAAETSRDSVRGVVPAAAAAGILLKHIQRDSCRSGHPLPLQSVPAVREARAVPLLQRWEAQAVSPALRAVQREMEVAGAILREGAAARAAPPF